MNSSNRLVDGERPRKLREEGEEDDARVGKKRDSESLWEWIGQMRMIDHHCHNILDAPECFESPLQSYFCEGDIQVNKTFCEQSKNTLIYLRSEKEIKELYGLDRSMSTGDVERFRKEKGVEALTKTSFERSGLDAIILDNGFKIYDSAGAEIPMKDSAWHQRYTKIYRVMRIESVLEESLLNAKKQGTGFQEWLSALCNQVDPLVNPAFQQGDADGIKVVGYKSIVAYRVGLAVSESPSPLDQVETEFNRVLRDEIDPSMSHYRVMSKPLIDWMLHRTLELNSKLPPGKVLPIQIHTGFGDPDLNLELANPVLLKSLITRYTSVPMVLLHCAYPYVREASFLAWVYPNIYVDIGAAVPYLSVSGMKQTLSALVEMCSFDKIFYSSDAHHIPESYYLAAKWSRVLIHALLLQSIENQEIDLSEAKSIALKLFRTNCIRVYNLDIDPN